MTGSERKVISCKTLISPPHQGLQSPWLPTSFTNTSELLLHRPNIKSYSMPPVSSGEPPNWGIKQQFQTVGSIPTHHTHNASGWILEILANVAKWTTNIQSKFQVCNYYSFKVISILKPKFWICTKLPLFSDPATYHCGTHAGSTYREWMKCYLWNVMHCRTCKTEGASIVSTPKHINMLQLSCLHHCVNVSLA